jgi:D-apiose dehydrogenase
VTLRGVAVGAGYFSQFHFDAWARVEGARLTALCDSDAGRAGEMAARFGIPAAGDDLVAMLDREKPDFIDIITPPPTHAAIVALAAERGIAVLCQKPLAPDFAQAQSIVDLAEQAGILFMAHDNFRFQPWHREIRRQIDAGRIGAVRAIHCRTRLGDGWGPDAYLSRQPYFRAMPRFLVHETGVHILDVFRFLGGEVTRVLARLDRLNPVIAGEDKALVLCDFANGASGLWDADRYHPAQARDPRYTFGAFRIEGSQGTLLLAEDGALHALTHDGQAEPIAYHHENKGFAGDCVFHTIAHFVEALATGAPHELSGGDYLRSLALVEAAYRSDRSRAWVSPD